MQRTHVSLLPIGIRGILLGVDTKVLVRVTVSLMEAILDLMRGSQGFHQIDSVDPVVDPLQPDLIRNLPPQIDHMADQMIDPTPITDQILDHRRHPDQER